MLGAFESLADETDGNRSSRGYEALDRGRRKDGRAVGLDHIRREISEFGTGKGFDSAGNSPRELHAAACLHSLQLVRAAIELVVADRIQFKPEEVHRSDRRLV